MIGFCVYLFAIVASLWLLFSDNKLSLKIQPLREIEIAIREMESMLGKKIKIGEKYV